MEVYLEKCYEICSNRTKPNSKFVAIQICFCHLCKIVYKDVDTLNKDDDTKCFLKAQIAQAANISNIEYFFVWVENMFVILLNKSNNCNVERALHTLKGTLQGPDTAEFPEENICEESVLNISKQLNATYKKSPFYLRAYDIHNRVKNFVTDGNEPNNFYSDELARILLKKYSAYVPLWTNVIGTFVEPDASKTTISNAPAEGYFNINKNVTLEGAHNIRATEYIRRAEIYVDARIQEVRDIFLNDTNDEPQREPPKRQRIILEEDTWKRTPKRHKTKIIKSIHWQKICKMFQKIPRALKDKRYVLLKFDDIFQKISHSMTVPPIIDYIEIKNLEIKGEVFNNVVDIYIGVLTYLSSAKKAHILTCEQGKNLFFSEDNVEVPFGTYEFIFMPIFNDAIFTLAVTNLRDKTFTYLNPHGENEEEGKYLLDTFVKKTNVNNLVKSSMNHRTQTDQSGVQICQYIEAILNGESCESLDTPRFYRNKMIKTLMENTDEMKFICVHCGEGSLNHRNVCIKCERPSCDDCTSLEYGTHISVQNFKCIFCRHNP